MHYFSCLAVLLSLSTVLLSAPTQQQTGLTIHQHATGKLFLKNGAIELAKTFLKYNKTIPPDVEAAGAAAVAVIQSGSVTATPEQYDKEYLCPIQIGTPGVTFNMDIDTGSSDFWVFSSEQPASQHLGQTYYNPTGSSTSNRYSGASWHEVYGDDSRASGSEVYWDKVVIGGVTATSQAVECATSVSSMYLKDTHQDGLIGLALNSRNTVTPKRVTTFMDNIASTLPLPLFTAYLKHQAAGSYDFGYIDPNKYSGKIVSTPITKANGFWEFALTGYQIGAGHQHLLSINAIADTGTSLILFPRLVVDDYYSHVSDAQEDRYGQYIFPCSSILPNFSVVIEGAVLTVPGAYMNFHKNLPPSQFGTCLGSLQSHRALGYNILGDVFLKSQFVVFNYSSGGISPSIGFAAQK